jgi:hypothetical protein
VIAALPGVHEAYDVRDFVRHGVLQHVIESFPVEHVSVETHEVVPTPAVRHSSAATAEIEPDAHCIKVQMRVELLGLCECCFAGIHDLLLLRSHFVSFSVLR